MTLMFNPLLKAKKQRADEKEEFRMDMMGGQSG